MTWKQAFMTALLRATEYGCKYYVFAIRVDGKIEYTVDFEPPSETWEEYNCDHYDRCSHQS